jgi:hypothetical protein
MDTIPKRLKKEPLIEALWQVLFEPKDGISISDSLCSIRDVVFSISPLRDLRGGGMPLPWVETHGY